ncbi:MAG TPA: hypothetical protein VMU68_01335 [Acidimicrobiales bacterium]|nr:hypothetical protein [Acidimicrobiales bacterium]
MTNPATSPRLLTILHMAANEPDCLSALCCRLTVDENVRRRLDLAFVAAGHLERALVQWALTNLVSMRRATRWRDACLTGAVDLAEDEEFGEAARKIRNEAFRTLREEYSLTEYGFTKRILEIRRDSKWIGEHVPSKSALVHAARVWESFAAHLFRGAGRPKVPRP